MDEQEWLACTDLPLLIKHLRGSGHDRKLRLFACACVRRLWDLLPPKGGGEAVEVAERFADGVASAQELAAAHGDGFKAWSEASLAWAAIISGGMSVAIEEPSGAALYTAVHAPAAKTPPGTPSRKAAQAAERRAQLALLRDIFGNPFRPVTLSRSWLTPDVLTLAQAAYEQRTLPAGTLDPARLALLADGLEDAGCAEADILGHLRREGPHVRGCWVVDLVLGLE